MKRHIKKIGDEAKKSAIRFKQQFKKSLTTAIIAAFGLILALTWNDVIIKFVEKISEASSIQNSLISALIITLISVLGIVIVSGFNK